MPQTPKQEGDRKIPRRDLFEVFRRLIQDKYENFAVYLVSSGWPMAIGYGATFWWTPAIQPKTIREKYKLSGKWAHFQMNLTSSLRTTDPKAADAPNFCFNPYLEGGEQQGIVSNCRNCHQFAGIQNQKGPDDPAGNALVGNPPLTLPYWPLNLAAPTPQPAQNVIGTRMIWSIHSRYTQLAAEEAAAAVAAQAKSAAAPAAGKQGVNSAAPKPR